MTGANGHQLDYKSKVSLTEQTITQQSNAIKNTEFIVETHHTVNMLSIEVCFTLYIFSH